MRAAPRGLRLMIGIFGRRNVGKSSLLNALTRQDVSIVSARAGTTTDPVEKPMELLPVGPVLFIDTAGIDDVGALGAQRVARTRQVLERCDVGVLVAGALAWWLFTSWFAVAVAAVVAFAFSFARGGGGGLGSGGYSSSSGGGGGFSGGGGSFGGGGASGDW